jgi:hypothetical protein
MSAIAKLAYKRGEYGYALFDDWTRHAQSCGCVSSK